MTGQSTNVGQGSGAAPKPELTSRQSANSEGTAGTPADDNASSQMGQVRRLLQNLRSVIRGKDESLEMLVTAMLAGGS
ncbi:MAG: hypothetical protein VB858_04875, partial [Planctomycetaceae bacterium]